MKNLVTCFLPVQIGLDLDATIQNLKQSGVVGKIILVGETDLVFDDPTTEVINPGGFSSTKALREFARIITTSYTLLYTKSLPLGLGQNALHRMMQASES